MPGATKQPVQHALAEALHALKRARAALDDVSESYAEDLANVELGDDEGAEHVRVLTDGGDLLREAGEHLSTAHDDLHQAQTLVDSA